MFLACETVEASLRRAKEERKMGMDYTGAKVGRTCSNCGERVRVVSAKRLLHGKKKARIVVACGCSRGFHRPTIEERRALLIRH